jgi:hypothetical protein
MLMISAIPHPIYNSYIVCGLAWVTCIRSKPFIYAKNLRRKKIVFSVISGDLGGNSGGNFDCVPTAVQQALNSYLQQ